MLTLLSYLSLLSSLSSPPHAVPLESRPNRAPLPTLSLSRYLSTHAAPPPVSNPPCKGVIITKQGSAFTFGRNVSGQLGLGASSVLLACARACAPVCGRERGSACTLYAPPICTMQIHTIVAVHLRNSRGHTILDTMAIRCTRAFTTHCKESQRTACLPLFLFPSVSLSLFFFPKGDEKTRTFPRKIDGLSNIVDAACGRHHTLFLDDKGQSTTQKKARPVFNNYATF